MIRQLSLFRKKKPLTTLEKIKMIAWMATRWLFENTWFPRRLRPFFLRIFGAKIGRSVLIRNSVRIHKPWLIAIGDNCWIGEGVWISASERISIENDVCVSQKVTLCSGSHDFRSTSLQLNSQPIILRSGSWICIGAYVLSGVTIGKCSVVAAGEISRKSLPDYSMLIGGQVRQIDPPK